MVVDLRSQRVADVEQFEANVDTFVAELKAQVDAQSTEYINKFEDWLAQKYDDVVGITEVTYEEVHDLYEAEAPEMIVTATKSAAAAEPNSSAYVGYGILSMGVVLASATYLYKKRQAKQVTIDSSTLLQNDGFEQV